MNEKIIKDDREIQNVVQTVANKPTWIYIKKNNISTLTGIGKKSNKLSNFGNTVLTIYCKDKYQKTVCMYSA